MSDKERIELGSLLHKLKGRFFDEMVEMKEEFPLMADYLDLELNELIRQYDEIHKRSPVKSEDEAMLYFNFRRIEKEIGKIKNGLFPYLWDEKLYTLMKKAMDGNLGITNNWVKVLIASNLLELSLNQALINKKPELFERLKKEHANIVKKTEEVNKILETEKLKRSDVHFINSHRVDADHPISEIINDLDPASAKELIGKVDECLTRLQPLLQTKNSNSEYDEEDYLSGKYNTGKASKHTRELYFAIKQKILANFRGLEAHQKKAYVGFYYEGNGACICTLDVAKSKIKMTYSIPKSKMALSSPNFIRDVSKIGIFGVGHYQSEIKSESDLEKALPFIKKVYDYKIEN